MNFETIIGLECHVELKTDSKMFSPSPAHFGAEPNTNTNVIDWGYPGVLPVVNTCVRIRDACSSCVELYDFSRYKIRP